MKIRECEFPDDRLYDDEGMMWAREEPNGEVVVGITSILAAIGGRLSTVTAKPVGVEYARGRSIGTLESGKYFGTLRTPISGLLVDVNHTVLNKPKILSEFPYREGWFARLWPASLEQDKKLLRRIDSAAELLGSQITALRIRCFAAFPDYEMFEIGTECAAVLVKLNELMERMELGEVVHIVSDDWTAPVEMARWSEETEQPVIDSRKEGNLFHYLVRKTR